MKVFSVRMVALVAVLFCLGSAATAEASEGACEKTESDDPGEMMETALALYREQKSEEAENWVDCVLEIRPDHGDARVLSARLLAHRGEFAMAQQRLEGLSADARDTLEVRRLEADVALWRGDYDEAARRYAAYLEEVPGDQDAWTSQGHARLAAGRQDDAEESYRQGCHLGSEASCRSMESFKNRGKRRYYARIQPGYSAVRDRPDGQSLRLAVGGPPTEQTALEVGYHLVRRGFADDITRQDMGVTVDGGWSAADSGLRLGAGGGWTFAPEFSPQWMAYLEGGWTWQMGLDAGLRVWRVQFPTAGANIMSPSLTYYRGPWMFDGRYYLAVHGDGDLDHSVFGRVAHYFGDYTSVHVGAGVGNRPDYIEMSTITDTPLVAHYTGLVGGTVELGSRQRLGLDLIYRQQSNIGFGATAEPVSNLSSYRSLEVMANYTVLRW